MSEKPSGYRIQYAPSARAKCKGPKPCKGTSIDKDALRFGTRVGSTSFAWRHWGCVTKKILSNVKEKYDTADTLDGYDHLSPEDQARVVKAYEEGTVAYEDVPDSAKFSVEKQEKLAVDKASTDDESDEELELEEKPKKYSPAKNKATPENAKGKVSVEKRAAPKVVDQDNEAFNDDLIKEFVEVPPDSDEEEEEEKVMILKKAPAKKATSKKMKIPSKNQPEEDVKTDNGTGDSPNIPKHLVSSKTTDKSTTKQGKAVSNKNGSRRVAD